MKRFFITFFAMIAIAASTNANNLNSVRDEALMHIDHYNNLYHGYDWNAKKRAEKDIDELTRDFTEKIDSAFKAKSDEIMKL